MGGDGWMDDNKLLLDNRKPSRFQQLLLTCFQLTPQTPLSLKGKVTSRRRAIPGWVAWFRTSYSREFLSRY